MGCGSSVKAQPSDGKDTTPAAPGAAPASAPASKPAAAPKAASAPATVKKAASAPVLGVVQLDTNEPTKKAFNPCHASMGYDIIYKEVEKLTFEMAGKGEMTEEAGKNFDEAIKYLEGKGCSAITGDCGLMMAFQNRARKVAKVPALMSSMVQCPAIACSLEPEEKILIVTKDAETLRMQKGELLKDCGFDVETARFSIVGISDIDMSKPTKEVQPAIVKKVADTLKGDRSIRAILLESTQLPPYADALRAITKLPVWDCVTMVDFITSSYMDNPRFGLNDWQEKMEHTKTQDLSDPKPSKEQIMRVHENLSKKQHPMLGCIRLDFNFNGAKVGDVQNPASFGYDVIYKAVPGLTFALAQEGKMEGQVLEDFKNSVKFLEEKGASCITGDCGFFMAYQKQARDVANVPVFMSSMVQCPMVSAMFAKDEKILILTANSESLLPQKEVLLSSCGFNVDDDHFVIEGCQDIPGFEAVLEGKVADVPYIEKGMMVKMKKIMEKTPNIKAIVCECHGLPQWADAMRTSTGLPVFDIVTCADFFISSMRDNPRFGMNNWQHPWDQIEQEYQFGKHLTAAELGRVETQPGQC
mmetsp:Transcript_87695/g.151994  ORF Transcript_87695/g.151994 Transcript_87695/m.151994 type:complete len:585 (+) Transcript_87695:76-1830(+)